MDITQLISVVGLPGVLCILMMKQNQDMKKTVDRNTEVLYLIAGVLGVKIGKGETK